MSNPSTHSEIQRYVNGAQVDNAVALVTAAYGDRRNVMTASFFAECSHVPPLLRVSIATGTYTHALIARSGRFGLSLLGEGQEELALGAGTRSGRDADKFAELDIVSTTGAHGVPLVENALTTSECLVVGVTHHPDHTLFIGEVVTSFRQSRLAYRRTLLVSDLARALAGATAA